MTRLDVIIVTLLQSCSGAASCAQVQFSPDGRWIVSASFDKAIKLWDGIKGVFVATFRGHVGPVYQVSWSSDSRLFVSGSKDSTLKVCLATLRSRTPSNGVPLFTTPGHGCLGLTHPECIVKHGFQARPRYPH